MQFRLINEFSIQFEKKGLASLTFSITASKYSSQLEDGLISALKELEGKFLDVSVISDSTQKIEGPKIQKI